MKASIKEKLDHLLTKKAKLESTLSSTDASSNQAIFLEASKELHTLLPVCDAYQIHLSLLKQFQESSDIIDEDPSMRHLVQEEQLSLKKQIIDSEQQLMTMLLPKDRDDDKNVYLEIRAGTGGDEAAIFVGDLARMYQLYGQQKKWQWDVVNSSLSDQGGYKELVVNVKGKDVSAHLEFESGTHRVQRVPETESQGRIHTSACTVAILPEVEEMDAVELDPSEIRVDTFRSSGAGGQHVNTTDSAVRLTHVPTGIVVECQDERSQHKNKAKASNLLKAKILAAQKQEQDQKRSETRRSQVGSGDRSERIRTYNFPQGRVSDHRINLTLYKLDQLMEGSLDLVVEPLAQEERASKMASLDNS